ncbi:hypothetical protein FB45DRAFT_955732 [Roridomyces roridus]|uniref:Uncharacterized protein n=1 Tax=Roridomyces roridus TaxID=1738132 RepID=A0AAD7F8Q8_9AGAR|nr:hypothetical protein FB45DRAFT_955732 [Roridomyces roridus]
MSTPFMTPDDRTKSYVQEPRPAAYANQIKDGTSLDGYIHEQIEEQIKSSPFVVDPPPLEDQAWDMALYRVGRNRNPAMLRGASFRLLQRAVTRTLSQDVVPRRQAMLSHLSSHQAVSKASLRRGFLGYASASFFLRVTLIHSQLIQGILMTEGMLDLIMSKMVWEGRNLIVPHSCEASSPFHQLLGALWVFGGIEVVMNWMVDVFTPLIETGINARNVYIDYVAAKEAEQEAGKKKSNRRVFLLFLAHPQRRGASDRKRFVLTPSALASLTSVSFRRLEVHQGGLRVGPRIPGRY